MGASKLAYFPQKQIHPAKLFRALGHPARYAIVKLLAKNPGLTQIEMAELIPLSPATVAQHMRVLRSANLILDNTTTVAVPYKLGKSAFTLMRKLLSEIADESAQSEELADSLKEQVR